MNKLVTRNIVLAFVVFFVALLLALSVSASGPSAEPSAKKDSNEAPVFRSTDADSMRAEGEQRFRANCGRCHAAPQKFSPRVMATVVRHMRVRATITSEDSRLILFYMTQ
jgi:cytochrome c5